MGCHSLLQGIFPTQGSNAGLLHCRQVLNCLSPKGAQVYYARWKNLSMLEYRLKGARNEGKVEDLRVEGGGRKF